MRTQHPDSGQHVIGLDIQLEPREVLRMMGCGRNGSVRSEVRDMVTRVLEDVRHTIRPRCVYVVRSVRRMTQTEIELDACQPFHGPIAGFLKPSERVAVFVITLGSEIESTARELMTGGKLLEGYTWDAIGSAAADIAVDALTRYLFEYEAGADEGITPPFSPGYCGMAVEEQRTLFSIVDTSPIGVKLWPTCMMEPVKSISGLMGIGPREAVVQHGVPCQWCHLESCKMRR